MIIKNIILFSLALCLSLTNAFASDESKDKNCEGALSSFERIKEKNFFGGIRSLVGSVNKNKYNYLNYVTKPQIITYLKKMTTSPAQLYQALLYLDDHKIIEKLELNFTDLKKIFDAKFTAEGIFFDDLPKFSVELSESDAHVFLETLKNDPGWLKNITTLSSSIDDQQSDVIQAIVDSKNLTNLKKINFTSSSIESVDVLALINSPSLESLSTIVLTLNGVHDELLESLNYSAKSKAFKIKYQIESHFEPTFAETTFEEIGQGLRYEEEFSWEHGTSRGVFLKTTIIQLHLKGK